MFSRVLAGKGVTIFSTSLEGGRGNLGRTLRSCRGTLHLPRVPTGVTWTLSAGQGALLALQVGDLGHHVVTLVPLLGGLRGLQGLLRMIGISVARHTARPLSQALLHQPLGNLQDTRYHVTPAYPSHPGNFMNPVD